MPELTYEHPRAEWVDKLEAIELACFPQADPADLLSAADLRRYCEVFPEGGYVALDGDEPVGMGLGIFVDFDFDQPQHTIHEIAGEHQCENHDPDGDWYYGIDITVHPDHRKRGIGRRLYELRKDVVRRFDKRGIIAGGSMPGYQHHRHLTIDEYVAQVVAGDLYDPTLSFQLANGFEVRGLLEGYIDDPADDGWASLIVWENPDWSGSE